MIRIHYILLYDTIRILSSRTWIPLSCLLVFVRPGYACYPGKNFARTGDNVLLSSEIELCRLWLDQELTLLKRQVILLFETPANKTFFKHYLHQKFAKLSDNRLRPSTYREIRVFSLPHPISMVRDKTVIHKGTFKILQRALQ